MSQAVKKVAQVAVGAAIGFVQGGPWGAVIGAAMAFYVASQQDQLKTDSLRASEPSSQTLRSSKASARYVLGRVSTGGVLAWGQEQAGDQSDGEWLHMVYVLSEGAIDGVEEIYLGEEVIQSYGEHASYELIVDPSQVNAFLKANSPDWRDTQIGRGLTFVRLSFKYSAEKYPAGIPDVRFVVRGRRDIYDPRTGFTGYSENNALHILWFLRHRCSVPDDEIVFSSFANSANVCDEMVANPDGSTSPRYRSGCVIGADESRTQVMQKLQAACGGKLIRVGGRWMLQVGAYYGPYDFEITEDMVTGTVTGSTEPSNDSAINTVRGTFIDPSQAWSETDYPEVSVAEWVVADGGEAAETLSFSYVSDPYQAQRLANIELRRRRAGGTLSIPMNFVGYNCRPGRSVKVNLPSLNIVGEFIVTDWAMAAETGCNVSVAQNEPAIFDDAVGQPYNPIGFISLPTGGLGSPTNLTWSTDDAAEVVQGVLSWTPPAGTVTGYAVTVRQGLTAVQAQQVPVSAMQLPIAGLASGNYTMSVAALGPLTRSGEASITVNIDGPPLPESCVVQATIDTITLIPGNTLHGLNGGTYEFFFSTNPQATQGEYLGQGLTLTHTGLAFATNYAYFVRTKNAYGVSAFLKVIASTSTDVENMLDALKDKIESGQLAPAMREEIALISGPPSLPGSVNSRLKELDAQVTEITDQLGEQLTQVQSDLQEQIDVIGDLAESMPYDPASAYAVGQAVLGADGKLYQAKQAVPANNPPPNATYWTDIGQAVQTANGLAARVTTVETKVTEQDDKLTAQSTRIDGVQSSLTTTNQNVTAAQQAADAANALAGGKGKVIIQSAVPAAADRLAQNLWIDTTGNANTPKRWSGSAWVAVTDKAATDAAAAAANALSVAQTKADASVVDTLSSKVTQQGDTITSQGQAITGVQNSLTTTNQNVSAAQQAADAANALAGGKGKVIVQSGAPAAADRLAQNLWIDTTNNANTPKRWSGTAWVAVTDKAATDAAAAAANALSVAQTKADASVVDSLSSKVTQQGDTITSQGQAITGVQNSLSTTNQNVTAAQQAADAANALAGGKGKVIIQSAAPAAVDRLAQNLWIDTTGNANTPKRWNGSAWVAVTDKAATDAAAAAASALALAQTKADASVVDSLSSKVTQQGDTITSQGQAMTGLQNSLTTTNQNVTAAQQAAQDAANLAGGKGKVIVQAAAPAVADRLAQNLWIDTTGNANTPKRWSGSAWVAVTDKVATDAAAAAASALTQVATKADASTVSALSNTVTQQGQTITAQGSDITNIKASVGNVAGENLLLDPTFSSSNGVNQAAAVALARNDASVPAGAPTARVSKFTVPTATGNSYIGFISALNVRSPENGNAAQIAVASGETYDFELYAYVSGGRGQIGLWIQFYDGAGASVGHNWAVQGGDGVRLTTTTGAWVKLTGQATVPAACIRMAMTLRVGSGDATDVFMSGPVARKRAGQESAQASALQAVDARVTTAENSITSQGSAITKLDNTVAGKADNSALQALESTVSQQGSTLTSQGQAVTQLQSSVGSIAGNGANLIPAEYCSFTETLPAIQRRSSTTVTAETYSAAYSTHRLKVSDSTTDGNGYFCLYANNEMLNLRLKPSTKYIFSAWAQSGAADRIARLRHRYVNASGAQVEAHLVNLPLTTQWGRLSASFTTPAALVDRAELLIFTSPAAGSQDSWWDGFMLEEQIGSNTTPGSFAPGTSTNQAAGQATAISQLSTTVTQQGTAITAQAERIDGLYVQVNPEMEGDSTGLAGAVGSFVGVWTEQSARIEDGIATGKRIDTVQSQVGGVEGSVQAVSATVQQVSETIAGVDGRVSAMTTIKAETISGGRRVMAGLALGSDGETAEILAYAQRFAIVDQSSGQVTLPFVVSNGQVFINQAVINQAFIQNIVAGMTIRSQALNSQGLPLLELNFVTGAVSIRGQDANGSTLLNNGGVYVYDANGIERTAVGRLT